MTGFWDINIGNVVTIAALLFAFWKFNQGNKTRIQTRHEENLKAMAELSTKVTHLDECVDSLKADQKEQWRVCLACLRGNK